MSDFYSREARAAMAAAAREIFGDLPIEITETGINFSTGMFRASEDKRPYEDQVQKMLKNPAEGDSFLAKASTDKLATSTRAYLLQCRADKSMKGKEFAKAARSYLEAAEILCGARLPIAGAFSKAYMTLDKQWDVYDCMACFTGAAKALINTKDYAQALIWLGESHHVNLNTRWDTYKAKPLFDWKISTVNIARYYLQRFHLQETLADVYLKLGNTGANVYYGFQATVTLGTMPALLQTLEIRHFRSEAYTKLFKTACFRHPEPTLVAKLDVIDDKSHVHGSWRKIDLKKPGGLGPRMNTAICVHKGYLYVAGGEKYGDVHPYDQLWRLNLAKMDKWQPLETVPPTLSNDHTGYKLAVGPDQKAYYFQGFRLLHYFDLKTQKWGGIRTHLEGDSDWWPFIVLQDYSIECAGDRLYVFGGRHQGAQLGCNLLMELNLTTKIWRRLSGSAVAQPASFSEPGPRVNACSWIGKGRRKLYIMYGDADRMTAQRAGEPEGDPGFQSYAYDDLWSWDIKEASWTREKIVGNPPSPRSEMGSVYNPVLDKVVTFGGYSPCAPMLSEKEQLSYSYYADTFIYDFNENNTSAVPAQASASSLSAATVDSIPAKWRQILTRGFPTYRAQPHLFVDSATGKIYLFSGYINTEYVPSKVKQDSRSFADIWELRINIPGGQFDGVDLAEEARTAKAGPWQRCFSCGSAGPWKKCGGSCQGRVFFCNTQCLKDGWKEHKNNHKCRKV